MTRTSIEWTNETWNPVTGCKKVSAGCDNCYAERITERFHGKGSFEHVILHPDRLDAPLHWRKPRLVFVNSMSDLFHADVPDEFIARVFAVMAVAEDHTFQVLTKRAGRMASLLNSRAFQSVVENDHYIELHRERNGFEIPLTWPIPNVQLGTSIENQHWANIRIPTLCETPAAVRFLSCEPLLGSLDLHIPILSQWNAAIGNVSALHHYIDWVIVGGESGPKAQPMHPDWARSLRDQCVDAGVPFFFKQWGEWIPYEDDQPPLHRSQHGDLFDGHWFPADLGEHEPIEGWWWPEVEDCVYRRVGKKRAGRALDGRTWNEMPAVRA